MTGFLQMQEMRLASLVNTNTGIMLNLVTNDTQKILDAAMFFHFGKCTDPENWLRQNFLLRQKWYLNGTMTPRSTFSFTRFEICMKIMVMMLQTNQLDVVQFGSL